MNTSSNNHKTPHDLSYQEQQHLENEKAKEKVMTIEEMLGKFTKDNEEHVRQFVVDKNMLNN